MGIGKDEVPVLSTLRDRLHNGSGDSESPTYSKKKDRYCFMFAAFFLLRCRQISRWDNIPTPAVVRTNPRIADLEEHRCEIDYRFRKGDLVKLKDVLRIPPFFYLDNRCKVHGEEAMLLLLYRFAYPVRLATLEEKFGREYSQLSRIFNRVVTHLVLLLC